MSEEDRREALDHRDVLLAIHAILQSPSGRTFFKYIFKYFEIMDLPEIGMEGSLLSDKLGSLRAGRAIFKLVSEADPETAASLLAQNEKESHNALYKAQAIGTT